MNQFTLDNIIFLIFGLFAGSALTMSLAWLLRNEKPIHADSPLMSTFQKIRNDNKLKAIISGIIAILAVLFLILTNYMGWYNDVTPLGMGH